MESKNAIINNLRDVARCNNLRNLTDLGVMRLATIVNRVRVAEDELKPSSIMSIFIAWLQAKAMQVGLEALPVEEWCRHLVHAYSFSESEVLWYWDCSEGRLWKHLGLPGAMPEVRRRMRGVCGVIKKVFPRDVDASASSSRRLSGVPSDGLSAAFHGYAKQKAKPKLKAKTEPEPNMKAKTTSKSKPEPESEPELEHESESEPEPQTQPELSEASKLTMSSVKSATDRTLDISAGRLSVKTDSDWDTRSVHSARWPSLKTSSLRPSRRDSPPENVIPRYYANTGSSSDLIPPARYICTLCGAWGTHYVWDCPERMSPSQTTANTRKLSTNEGTESDQTKRGRPLTTGNPQKDTRTTKTSRGGHSAPRESSLEEDKHDDASSRKLGQRHELAIRSSRASRVPGAPSHDPAVTGPSNADLVEWSLSLKTERVPSPVPQIRTKDTARLSSWREDKRNECQGSGYAAAGKLKKLSAVDEVTLRCADDFFCRLERVFIRRYQTGSGHDLMVRDKKETTRKGPRVEAAKIHGGVGVTDPKFCFNIDAASVPCPASTASTESTKSTVYGSAREPSEIALNQTTRTPSAEDTLIGLSGEPSVQEQQHSAIELWEAGIDLQKEETSEDGE
ncbi:hypothetical protein E4U60_003691 [Claviceps pazoutovae]|uniref:Zinc knuckle CX2CX3GHX4C domain-containing protein n=1 Tax=Claviceps pazoutovae TaxID=1649127 RepID=A0A9P7SKI5_9HYPO|nr:hypothetical protein E4U60_003691 [Claviceps pazoutovae]